MINPLSLCLRLGLVNKIRSVGCNQPFMLSTVQTNALKENVGSVFRKILGILHFPVYTFYRSHALRGNASWTLLRSKLNVPTQRVGTITFWKQMKDAKYYIPY